jgi:hypothetical protein
MKLLSLVSEETSRGESIVNYTDWLNDIFQNEDQEDVQILIDLGKILMKLDATWINDGIRNRYFELHPSAGVFEMRVFVRSNGELIVYADDGDDRFMWGPIALKEIRKIDWPEFIEGVGITFGGLDQADNSMKYGSRKNVRQQA